MLGATHERAFDRDFGIGVYASGRAGYREAVGLGGEVRWEPFDRLGVDVFADALTAPLHWIAANAGEDGAVVIDKVSQLPAGHGFNAATLRYGDNIISGLFPYKTEDGLPRVAAIVDGYAQYGVMS